MCSLCIVSDTDFLPFTLLRTTASVVNKVLPPADDTTSIDIDIPVGLAFGNTSQTTAYVRYMHAFMSGKIGPGWIAIIIVKIFYLTSYFLNLMQYFQDSERPLNSHIHIYRLQQMDTFLLVRE